MIFVADNYANCYITHISRHKLLMLGPLPFTERVWLRQTRSMVLRDGYTIIVCGSTTTQGLTFVLNIICGYFFIVPTTGGSSPDVKLIVLVPIAIVLVIAVLVIATVVVRFAQAKQKR